MSQHEAPLIVGNPFFHRGPIRDRTFFFGRTRETRQALQMLRNGQCISIVGPRRIGETSFLFYLCDSKVQKAHGLGNEYLFIYIDCQGLGDLDKPQFYRWLWEETTVVLAERGNTDGWAESTSSFGEFRKAMSKLQEEGYKPIFLLDEFETIATNRNLDQDLFSDLRSLVPTMVYAVASQDSLYDLTYVDKSILSSPFFNIFEEIHLGYLKPEEAREMISELLRKAKQENLFTEGDFSFVIEIGGYYPFFLQLACSNLFELKRDQKDLTTEDYARVRKNYSEDTKGHFRYTWQVLDANEQIALKLMCKGGASQFDVRKDIISRALTLLPQTLRERIPSRSLDDEQKQRLEKKCILYNGTFFSSVFAEFVQGQRIKTRAEALKMRMRNVLDQYKKISAALIVILFVLSAILVWPDIPDWAMKELNVKNVTPIEGLKNSAGEDVSVKVYSPKLLFVGQTASIEVQTFDSAEKSEFEVTALHPSSDVVITKKQDASEIKCVGTNANMLSRSGSIELEVGAEMAGTSADTVVTVKTNYFLSLLIRVGVLLTSGGLSVKKLWGWLRPSSEEKVANVMVNQTGQGER